MKYTPEELYAWSMEKGFKDQLIITDMFRLLGIDTHGKVQKLVEDVKEEMSSRQAWNSITEGAKNKLEELKKEKK